MKKKYIKNYHQLATNPLRKKALNIIEAGYQAIQPEKLLKEKIKLKNNILFLGKEKIDLKKFRKIFLIGFGKGSFKSAKIIEKILAKKIDGGIILDIKGGELKKVKSRIGTHPLSSKKNIKYTKEIISLIKKTRKEDLILLLIFGGGSALLSDPNPGFSLAKLKSVNRILLQSGANIKEINIVRKHLSQLKGGGLAKLAYPAKVVSLIFSDVPGNSLETIASGPTVKDKSTVIQAKNIAKKYNLGNLSFSETPKENKYFKNVKNLLLVSNKIVLKAMKRKAKKEGFKVGIYSSKLQGEAKEAGKNILKKLKKRMIILAAGETIVRVKNPQGKGGRNQELVLGALPYLKKGQVIASCASDGWDNTPAAGAVADFQSKIKAEKLKLNPNKYLKNNNSFIFFDKLKDLIYTKGGINISDFLIALYE